MHSKVVPEEGLGCDAAKRGVEAQGTGDDRTVARFRRCQNKERAIHPRDPTGGSGRNQKHSKLTESFRRLLKRVHQPRDGAVEVFVGAAHLFDLVDRVEHGGVMFAAELPADFGQ